MGIDSVSAFRLWRRQASATGTRAMVGSPDSTTHLTEGLPSFTNQTVSDDLAKCLGDKHGQPIDDGVRDIINGSAGYNSVALDSMWNRTETDEVETCGRNRGRVGRP